MNKLLVEDPELNCLFIKFIERCHMLLNIHDIDDLDKVNENTDECDSNANDIHSCDRQYIQRYALNYCNDQQSKKYDITTSDFKSQYHQDALKSMNTDNSYHIRLHDPHPECESSTLINDKSQNNDIDDKTSDV